MSLLHSLILGILQGATEFLPVSSSGHLVIAQVYFGLSTPPVLFDTLLHLATLSSVVYFFRHQLRQLSRRQLQLVLWASAPTVVIGLILYPFQATLFNSLPLVGFGLLITSFVLISLKLFPPPKSLVTLDQLSIKSSLIIGLSQAIAIFPGISRSGSTVSTSLHQKLNHSDAFFFSFLISLPAIIGASLLELVTSPLPQFFSPLTILAGMGSAFISGFLSLSLLRVLIRRAHLWPFAIYCFIVAAIIILKCYT